MIALDNMVMAWGIRGAATAGQEEQVARAKRYLEKLGQDGKELAVPTPALAELLVEVPAEQHLRMITVMRRRFIMLDLDASAAARAAEVTARNFQRVRAEHPNQTGLRQQLKTDALILGVCLARGVRRIISEDAALRSMANGFPLEVVSIPDPPRQLDLFGQPRS